MSIKGSIVASAFALMFSAPVAACSDANACLNFNLRLASFVATADGSDTTIAQLGQRSEPNRACRLVTNPSGKSAAVCGNEAEGAPTYALSVSSGQLLQIADFDSMLALAVLALSEMKDFGGVGMTGELSLLQRSNAEIQQSAIAGAVERVSASRAKDGPYLRVTYETFVSGGVRELRLSNISTKRSVAVVLEATAKQDDFRVASWRPE